MVAVLRRQGVMNRRAQDHLLKVTPEAWRRVVTACTCPPPGAQGLGVCTFPPGKAPGYAHICPRSITLQQDQRAPQQRHFILAERENDIHFCKKGPSPESEQHTLLHNPAETCSPFLRQKDFGSTQSISPYLGSLRKH